MDEERRRVLLAPLLVWLALLALLAATCGYAFLPGLPAKLPVNLAISAGMAALIGGIFMQLRRASAIVLLASVGGVAWLSLLFLFSFADFLTR